MSDSIITSITSIVCLSTGWLLNEFGTWFKEKRENKRIRKNVLYHLLEIHYSIRKLDISKEVKGISELTMRLIPKEEHTEELRETLNQIYQSALGGLFEQNVNKELEDLHDAYLNSIESLSSVDPIMAYRLKGKTKITHGFDMMNQSISALQNMIGELDATSMQQQQAIIVILKPEIIQDLLRDIENEITEVARSINRSTKSTVQTMLNEYKMELSKNEGFQRYEQMILQVVEQYNQKPVSNLLQ